MKVHHVKHTVLSGGFASVRTYLVITPEGKSRESSPAVVFAPALYAITEIRANEFGSGLIDILFLHDALSMVKGWVESGRQDFSEFDQPSETAGLDYSTISQAAG